MMLERQILKTDYGVSYGSVTLKSLQNDNVPELDLLVRETIQNSSDASLNEPGNSYNVSFSSGKFNPSRFNSIMTDITEILDNRFPNETEDYLEIRDTKTSGLTGKIRKADIKKDDHGNFFKLIFDTGKRQTIATAGGNWGYGKSVYYRVGIGIVIFYSQIRNEKDDYENRLIITLVEDESKEDALGNDLSILNSIEPRSAGKGWWGIRDGEDLLPLQDMDSIKRILDVFGVKPFKANETGTSIIIPYIKTKELLEGIIPVESDIRPDIREHFVSIWASSISDYLRLAVQKWYAPKIHNREIIKFCDNKWLLVSIDNVPFKKQDMLPFFRLTQELYTSALSKTCGYEYKSPDYPGIVILPVKIRSYFENGMTSGYVAMIKISRSDLNGNENVLSPYDYIGKFEADGGLNEPIMMYARNPGMVIDYAITGAWVKNLLPPDSPDEYMFAFYVPDTKKTIKENLGVPEFAGMQLGAYLRECEASDHMGWLDPVKMQIVQRIQKNSINAITGHIKKSSVVEIDATASKLSNRLGRNLLPKIGYGKKKPGGSSGSGGGGSKTASTDFIITSQKIKKDEVEIDFVLKLMHGKKKAYISMMIASEAGWIDARSWEKDIGTEFPVVICNCFISGIKTSVSEEPYVINKECNSHETQIDTKEITVALLSETENEELTQINYESHLLNPEIYGQIRIRAYDKKYQYTFRVE